MSAAKVRHRCGLPTGEAVAAREGFEHPSIHGERLKPAGAKKQDTVRDFLPDPGQFEQAGLGRSIGQRFSLLQPARAGGEKLRRAVDVFGAKTQEAGAEFLFGDGGELIPGRQAVEICRSGFTPRCVGKGSRRKAAPTIEQWQTVPFRQQRDHLLDLDDLLRRAAQEAQQGLAEWLAQNPQPREGREALGEVGVAAPRERIRERGPVAVESEIAGQGGCDGGFERFGCAPQ